MKMERFAGEGRTDAPRKGRFVVVLGRSAHFLQSGSGPPVVLFHGNGSLGQEILSAFGATAGLTWIAPDRPGYGFSQPLPVGAHDPIMLADWLAEFGDAIGVRTFGLVAHSLSAGAALCFASRYPDRVRFLTLIAPFCRPTPHRWMLGLRLAVTPVVGWPLRKAAPVVAGLYKDTILKAMMTPNPVPPWLRSFPIRHAAQSRALLTTAAELRAFNAGMVKASVRLTPDIPVQVFAGRRDRTAEPSWHLPWLARRVPRLRVQVIDRVGHAIHHSRRALVTHAVVRQSQEAEFLRNNSPGHQLLGSEQGRTGPLPSVSKERNMKQKSLEDLFHDTLKDIYYAERKIVRTLPKMMQGAQSQELSAAFEKHLAESEVHIERLEQVFELLGKRAQGKTCPAIDGIIEEGEEILETMKGTPAIDAGLIAAAQAVEHYEIARYGTLCRWAEVMGMTDAATLLDQTLSEETMTDEALTQLADSSVNAKAMETADA
jgi:ferritin-like metal-binding protein YciE/pimeloyl-ACP methyl ester carboxylesterase